MALPPLYDNSGHFNYQHAVYFAGMASLAFFDEGPWCVRLANALQTGDINVRPTSEPLVPRVLTVGDLDGWTVAIEGTRNSTQWLSYIVASGMTAIDGIPGQCFQPFFLAANAAYLTVRPLMEPGDKVCLTGSSLGGAAAHIVARMLARDGFTISSVYGFGTPKVGDWSFWSAYGQRAYDLFHLSDPIPRCPPDALSVYVTQTLVRKRIPPTYHLGARVQVGEAEREFDPRQIAGYLTRLLHDGRVTPDIHGVGTYTRYLLAKMPKKLVEPLHPLLHEMALQGFGSQW